MDQSRRFVGMDVHKEIIVTQKMRDHLAAVRPGLLAETG